MSERSDFHIAIVGMSARFAGADTPSAFWANVRDGVECVTDFDDATLRARGVPESLLTHPNYVRRAPVLNGMSAFDAGFFGFTPKEAAILDPQHRHFLECAWEALESSGHPPGCFDGPVGVYAGNGMHAYMMYNLISNPALMESEGLFLVRHTGNDKDFLATRASYAFDLRGPSLTLQTACSTSLVAIHMATQALLNGEVDMALAGGVTIEQPHGVGYKYTPGEILSPDGRCRPFDAASQGTIFGSGCGVVALRRLNDAIDDGDEIYAVILGSAINNDGASKVGYLAPSVEGQARCATEALEIAEVDPSSIGFVECHGTGTPVGDPIEIAALKQAFAQEDGFDPAAPPHCALGSVKANIGHTDTAAGVAAAIKTAMALRHKELPPLTHFERPNPALELEQGPFVIHAERQAWPAGPEPRRAAVNSLGVGGTNAFVVMEEAPARPASEPPVRDCELMLLSAKSPRALKGAVDALQNALPALATAGTPMHDAAWTLQRGRTRFEHRASVVVGADGVFSHDDVSIAPHPVKQTNALGVAFMFAGGGAQYPGMGRALYDQEPVYREAVDACLNALRSHVDYDLKALLYPAPGEEAAAAITLQRPTRTLPSLFVSQYAQAKLWMSWGVEPTALIGHSMGEYTAACLAGVFTLEDALSVVALRGRLFEAVEPGAMLSVEMDADALRPLLGEACLAAVNAPGLALASGPIAEIERIEAALAERDIGARRVRIDVAAHSSMLDPVLDTFREHLSRIRFGAIETPFVSNLTGQWADDAVRTAEYWVRHLREPVRFADGAQTLLHGGPLVALEVGPGHTMTSLVRLNPAFGEGHTAVNSAPRATDSAGGDGDLSFMLGRLGAVWGAGIEADWEALHRGRLRYRVPLPTYAWDHEDYWISPGEHAYRGEGSAASEEAAGALTRSADPDAWFWSPTWRSAPLAAAASVEAPRTVLIFDDEGPLGAAVRAQATERGMRAVWVRSGAAFSYDGGGAYRVRPDSLEDHHTLWKALERAQYAPDAVIDLRPSAALESAAYEQARAFAFAGPLGVAQCLTEYAEQRQTRLRSAGATREQVESEPSAFVPLLIVTDGLYEVAGEAAPHPIQALSSGIATVLPAEAAGVRALQVDVRARGGSAEGLRALAEDLLRELEGLSEAGGEGAAQVVALRGRRRWAQDWERRSLPADPVAEAPDAPRALSASAGVGRGGFVLITGGFGGLGRSAAQMFAAQGVHVALLGRTPLPPEDTWSSLPLTYDARHPVRARVAQVQALRAAGIQVVALSADVADAEALRGALDSARRRLGRLLGVVHTAGVLDDNLMILRTLEDSERVLAPKVRGVRALDAATADDDLAFFVTYGSVSASMGLAGQADYAAANAYLAAWAQRRADTGGGPAQTIAWPAWQEVGMAAELQATGAPLRLTGGAPTAHPLVQRCVRAESQQAVFVSDLTADMWVLDEHRTASGTAVFPGAGYLELARAALVYGEDAGRAIEATDVVFLSPLTVPDSGARRVRVTLDRDGAGHRVTISSGGADATDIAHARMRVALSPLASEAVDVAAIRARCPQVVELPPGPRQDPHVRFGQRWSNLRRMAIGAAEALLTLELPEATAGDLDDVRLHPALLDFATAGAQQLIASTTSGATPAFYVPAGYERLTFGGTLPPNSLSHVRVRPDESGGELAVFDITWVDTHGNILANVEAFSMRRVAADTLDASPLPADVSEDAVAPPVAFSGQEPLANGVSTQAGIAVLRRAIAAQQSMSLGAEVAPLLVVSPIDFRRLLSAVHEAPSDGGFVIETSVGTGTSDDDETVAPRNPTERAIADIWQAALGAPALGVHADFFSLGGHSLSAIRITSRINTHFGVDLPLRSVFEAPTIAELSERVQALGGGIAEAGEASKALAGEAATASAGEAATASAGEAATALAVSSERSAPVSGPEAIPTCDRRQPVRPSFAQEGLWFVEQIQPGNRAYNIPIALRLEGPLDLEALERALTEVVRRHEAMRTTFSVVDGAPMLEIHPPYSVRLTPERIGKSARARRTFADASANAAFDLSAGPLFRAALGRSTAKDHTLVLTLHHIVSDEWSLELLVQELGPLYSAARRDESLADALPELPVQFADLAAWRRARLDGPVLDRQLAYWVQRLQGAEPVLELPADRPRPPVPSLEGARYAHTLDAEVAAGFRTLAAQEGVTPFVAMMAAFQVLMYRLTGQNDLIVGTPSSTRSRTEAESLIGFFVNTLAFRADLWGRPSFREMVARTRVQSLDAFANNDVPLDRVVRALNLRRDPSRTPLYQVMFALFPSSRESEFLGLQASPLDVDSGGAQVDLTLYVSDSGDGFRALFEYNTDIFDEATIAGFAEAFESLLGACVASPHEAIEMHPLVGDSGRKSLLQLWNSAPGDADTDMTLHGLFADQCSAQPDACAVRDADGSWKYGELRDASDAVATALRNMGVGSGDFVGVCLHRNRTMLAVLLGVMQSGAAYLPLDPGFPHDRLVYMVRDAAAPVVVAEAGLVSLLHDAGPRMLCVEDLDLTSPTSASAESGTEFNAGAAADAAAYVIYTSGSTGRPKGVQVPHGSAVNFIRSMAQAPGLSAGEVAVALTTISFDISVLELFLPISVGATVVIVDKDVAADGTALEHRMHEVGATLVQATPATWRLLVAAGWPGTPGLKALCGGEALPPDLARELIPRVGALWNMYGPTETTVWSTTRTITDAADITIGTPIANTVCHVLDSAGNLLPPMVPGLLWIGGHGVTDGYVNRAEMTAERFVPDPFFGGRMYNTGDRVRRLHDGSLDYLSRVDHQVKVRGYRIELGEIEAEIARHASVARCVVVVVQFAADDARLVAYVVPNAVAGAGPARLSSFDAHDVREALRAALPEYMVPAHWVPLEAVPLTPNGKVDRKALPDPRAQEQHSRVAPSEAPAVAALTPNEQLLADVWQEALGVERVDVHDNFFDIGGHSLLAMKLIAQVEDRTGVRFNPLSISLQTLGQMAAVLDREQAAANAQAAALSGDTAPADAAAAVAAEGTPGVAESDAGDETDAPPLESATTFELGSDGHVPASEYGRLIRKVASRWAQKLRGSDDR